MTCDCSCSPAAAAFDVTCRVVREPDVGPGACTVDHSAGRFLVGPDGQLLTRFGHGTPVSTLLECIEHWPVAVPR
jgi:hypothetical protein